MAKPCDERWPLVVEPLKRAVVVAASLSVVSGLMLGYDVGSTNGVLLPVTSYFGMSPNQQQLFAGILNVAAVPGCLAGGYVAEWCGRRRAIGIGSALFIVGNALMVAATSYGMLLVGRAVAGLALGLTMVTGPLYTAEVAPSRLRGMLSTNVEVSYNVGIVVAFVVSWAMVDLPDETKWRWMLGVCLIFPVVSLVGVLFVLPESPRWLASTGRLEDAEVVLRRLLGPKEAERSLEALSRTSRAEAKPEMSWCETLTSEKTRWLMFLGSGLAFFAQISGIDCIMYYSTTLLSAGPGLSQSNILLAMVVMGLLKLAAIIAQGTVVDALGRRPLLVLSGVGMGLSMLFLGLAFNHSWSWQFEFASITSFVVCFSLGIGPIVYTINAELYPEICRTKGLSLAMGVGRTVSAINTMTFLSLANLLTTGGAFMAYACACAAMAAFVAAFVPETKGRSLEENNIVDKRFAALAA